MLIKNIIFDLDGTLMDTASGILQSVEYTIKACNLAPLTHEKMLSFIGPPIQESFLNTFDLSVSEALRCAKIFRDYYLKEALFKASLYNGILELCSYYSNRDFNLLVATYKREEYAKLLISHFGLDPYFKAIYGSDSADVLKKKDIVHKCINYVEGSEEDTVLVGDTLSDAKASSDNFISFIGVTYGFGFHTNFDSKKLPCKCLGMANSITELRNIIDEYSRENIG